MRRPDAPAATRLRESIAAERKRLDRRPVPTEPWIMPAGLDELDALLDVVDAAREVVARYATVLPHGEIDRAVSSLKDALARLDYVPTGEGDQARG